MTPVHQLLLLCCLLLAGGLSAQQRYFPPHPGNAWETTPPAELGWCQDSIDALYDFLDAHDTRAFLVVKNGQMVLERYFGTFGRDDWWYWASAGKTLTAFMVGQAQEQGLLNTQDAVSRHLGVGWTAMPPALEAEVRVVHQLTMTTGFDDRTGNVDCTDDSCLTYLAEPGTRWAYHNAPYTLLSRVLEAAGGATLNSFFQQNTANRLGMRGAWVQSGYNRVYWSDARSVARFGLMVLNEGVWEQDTLMRDTTYFRQMIRPSQAFNPAYGYLWWLNGQNGYMIPRVRLSFPGLIIPSAPADLLAGLGSNDQKLYVVPSENMVVVRLGGAADALPPLAVSSFDADLWQRLSHLACASASTRAAPTPPAPLLYPNPARNRVRVVLPEGVARATVTLRDPSGRVVPCHFQDDGFSVSHLRPGLYLATVGTARMRWVCRLVVE